MPAIDFDQYMKWIHDDTNPKRVQNGLEPINDEDAKKCYEIMEDFLEEWRKPYEQRQAEREERASAEREVHFL